MEIKKIAEVTIAERDKAAAMSLVPKIERCFAMIENLFELIDEDVSEWNSPGAKSALQNAIERGIVHNDFDKKRAMDRFNEYFKKG